MACTPNVGVKPADVPLNQLWESMNLGFIVTCNRICGVCGRKSPNASAGSAPRYSLSLCKPVNQGVQPRSHHFFGDELTNLRKQCKTV